MSKKVKLTIDKKICIQCGTCAMLYDKYFFIKDSGEIDDTKASVDEAEVTEIIQVCPVKAIKKSK